MPLRSRPRPIPLKSPKKYLDPKWRGIQEKKLKELISRSEPPRVKFRDVKPGDIITVISLAFSDQRYLVHFVEAASPTNLNLSGPGEMQPSMYLSNLDTECMVVGRDKKFLKAKEKEQRARDERYLIKPAKRKINASHIGE